MGNRTYKLQIIIFIIGLFLVILGAIMKVLKVDYSIVPLVMGIILKLVAIISSVIKFLRK